MGKQSRRQRVPAPTGMDSVAAKRRVQNQLAYSETELLEVFNSRAVTQFMTSTEDEQRKLISPVLQERLHACMPQVACPPDRLEDYALKAGMRLNKMHLPTMIGLLRGPTDAFVSELQVMFDDLRASDEHDDADLNERQLLAKWLGNERVIPFLRGRPSERRAELSTTIRCEVLAAHKALGLRYNHAHYEEHNALVVNYVIEEIFLLDMQDILAMWDGATLKPRDQFVAFMEKLAPGAHAFAQRMRKGRAKTEADAQGERAREEAMERIRAFRAYARKRGAAFAERVVQSKAVRGPAPTPPPPPSSPPPPDWHAIEDRKQRAARRDRIAHAREVLRDDRSLQAIAARSLDEALSLTQGEMPRPENYQRYYDKFSESLLAQGYPPDQVDPLVEILRRKFEGSADTEETVRVLMSFLAERSDASPTAPQQPHENHAANLSAALGGVSVYATAIADEEDAEMQAEREPEPEPEPEPEQRPEEDGWVGGLAEEPPPPPPRVEPEVPQGWKPIEWMNSRQYKQMMKAPGAAGDRLRAQVANVMDRAMERGANARDAAVEAEMVATDAAACDRDDARVQAKRDKKAKRRARKEKEEQAAKRELEERRKARISRLVDEAEEAEEAEGAGVNDIVEQVHACDSPGSSSQHAAATDPQDDEFCNDMERALQLSAEEATYREVQAVLAEDAAPVAPAPAPQLERATAECAVCWEAATHLVSPCGHFCLCEACSRGMSQCPICRGGVQSIIKVFVS